MKTQYLLIFLLLAIELSAQDAPIKWKEIAMEDLQMTDFEADTSAPAIILCDYGQRYFDTNPNGRNLFLFNERHIRIKILKPEGLKYAAVRIPYKDMTCEDFPGENSIIIKGMTYHLNKKGEVVATKLKQKNIKKTDSTGCFKIATFTLPNVEPGSVIEYKYSIPTLDLVSPGRWYFQNEIPTLYSEFRMRVPTQFSYMFSPQNFQNFDINEEKYFNQAIHLPQGFNPYYQYYRRSRPPFNLSGKEIRLAKFGVEKNQHQAFTNNPKEYLEFINIHLVRATRDNVDYLWDYLTHALIITTKEDYDLYDPKQRKLITYPASYIHYDLPDWGKFNQKLIKSDRFGLALIKHWDHEQILNNIIKDSENPEQKLVSIYDHLRNSMNWNGKYSVYVNPVFNHSISKFITKITKKLPNEKTLRKPFEKGEGTSSEINFILIYLLNKAGIETHPVLINTKDYSRIDTLIPDVKQFNHVIALANLNGKRIFLDATDSIRPYTIVDKNHLSPLGFLVKKDAYEWLSVQNTETTESVLTEKMTIEKDLSYTSSISLKEYGYFALDHRKEILTHGRDSFALRLDDNYSGSDKPEKMDILNVEKDLLPLEFEIKKSGKLKGTESMILVKPNFRALYSPSDFKDVLRKYPVDFGYPFKQSYILEIDIPEGYTAELPKKEIYETYGGNAGYQYEAKISDQKIQLRVNLEFKIAEFPAHEYTNLVELFRSLKEKMEEEISIDRL